VPPLSDDAASGFAPPEETDQTDQPGSPPQVLSRQRYLVGGLSPLRYRNFAIFILGFATSATGRAIEATGSVWLVYELTHSPILLGLVGIAQALPTILTSPIAGVVSDRVSQRRLLFLTQGLSLVLSLALALLIVTGRVQLWHIYLQVALETIVTSFDSAARQALFPRLVPRSELPEAVTLTLTSNRVAKLIGPVVGGLAIAAMGMSAPFFLNAASFLALMAAVMKIRGIPGPVTGAVSVGRELLEGIRYIIAAPILSGLFMMEIIFSLFEMNAVLITIVARELLRVGPEGLGLLIAAPALGSFLGVTWLMTIGRVDRQGRFGIVCTLAYAAVLFVFACSTSFLMSASALILIGALDFLITVTRNSVMQLSAPARMRGRIMANLGLVTRGIGPLADTQSGVLAAFLGVSLTVFAAGTALAAAACLTAIANPTLWLYSRSRDVNASRANK
jgi:MFS family permease